LEGRRTLNLTLNSTIQIRNRFGLDWRDVRQTTRTWKRGCGGRVYAEVIVMRNILGPAGRTSVYISVQLGGGVEQYLRRKVTIEGDAYLNSTPELCRKAWKDDLSRYTGARSGGEISIMTSSAMGMSFDLVTSRIGYHHGEDQAKISSL